jgi:ribosomal protein S18 acetylase RimI-like enzyme
VTVTDVKGIGRVVADVVFNPTETRNKVVYVAGDTVSYAEVADVVEGVYGGEWKREEWDREYLKRKLEEHPEDLMVKYQNAFGAGVGVSWEMERTLNYQRGIKLTNLREYVEEYNEDLLQRSE